MLGLGGLAACSNESASNNNEGSKGSNDSKEKEEVVVEPAKFTIMANLHTPEVPSDKIEKIIEEKTGADITIQWTPDSNYEEKLSTSFATGTFPEAVFMKNITTFLQFKEAIRDGQFWEIGPYLDEFPNLKKLNETVLDNTKVDGKLYTLYQGRPLSRQGLIYRKDWAEKLGLPEPTNVEEFREMARAFTEDDPDGNGKNDTFGLTDRSDLIYGAFKTVASWHNTPNGWGEKDGQLLPEFMFDEYVDTMDFFKDLRDNGYINQDFPVTSKEDQQAFLKNGTAGMYVGSMHDVQSLYNDAVKINPDIQLDVQNKIVGPDGEYRVWSLPGYGTVVMFPKSAVKDEAQLKGILAFFDKLVTPEVSNTLYWGVEGEHYTVQDGQALPSEDSDLTDREVKPYQALEIGEPQTNGRYEGLATYEVKAKADELVIENEQYLIHDPTNALDSPTHIEKGEILSQLITDATYNYILGKLDKSGFDKVVEEWKKGGGEKIIEEFNEAYSQAK
ncbi:extracellular solute-binding protein [Bacillus sp. FJAT-50079]|uniref:extracellular solute-binding protein n=1 Tax=Bacillus sp. FJAT-50079 TaxID=2833577 RepID=UPI001BC9848B|nr:extracellular solute-binding protein [Bacillus sp. FJAT-50079]MBS4207859.1 extracellular solute-binding protein [Bacillus sp. FJAT-50079]